MHQMSGMNTSNAHKVITFVGQQSVKKTRNVEKLPLKLSKLEMLDFLMKHDADKDGKLSWDELRQAFSNIGVKWVSLTTDRAFIYADDDKDGYISEREMEKLIDFSLKLETKIKPVPSCGIVILLCTPMCQRATVIIPGFNVLISRLLNKINAHEENARIMAKMNSGLEATGRKSAIKNKD